MDATASNQSLKLKAAGGAIVTIATQATRFLVQIASTILLARLLAPEDFGVYAMTAPVVAIINLIKDLGLTQAIVTSSTISKPLLSAMFYVNLALSVGIAAVIALAAPLVATFYDNDAVIPVVQFVALGVAMNGTSSVHRAILTRDLRYGTLGRIEIVSAAMGVLAGLTHAWIAPSALAIATVNVVTGFVQLVQSWTMTRWMPGRPGNRTRVLEMLKFGGGLTGFNLTNFFARNADNVIIGKFIGAGPLGYYDRAYKLMLMPLQQINGPAGRVMIPIMSRLMNEPGRYRFAYLRALRILLLVTMPIVCFCIASAYELIPFLLGPQWTAASDVFVWLSIAALHQPLTATIGWLFITQNRTGEFAKWGVVNAVTCVMAFMAGLPWGVVGVAAAYAISDLVVRMPAVWWYVGRKGPVDTRDLFQLGLVYGMTALLVLGGLLLLRMGLLAIGWPVIVILVAMACAACALYWCIIALTASGRATIGEGIELVVQQFRKRFARHRA
ncbi:MAG: flippase [Croceicoccus sp.]|nr:flippase [Croceicoccus sp.]MAL24570.1 flippase [Croceicoccus sp.]